MLIRAFSFCFLLASTLIAADLSAEAYRWVDENGKVHFGDRPPNKSKATDISGDISKQNIDSASGKAKAQLEQIDRRQSAQKTEKQQLSKGKEQRQQQLSKYCKEARKRLNIIKGRVIFYDDDGKEIKTTEKERAAQAASLERQIQEYCL